MSKDLKEKILELLEEPLREEGCELADSALSRYKQSTMLRLYVYSKNGASLTECARISRIVGDLIDGTDLLSDGYTLEVSSPGLDRPLVTATDFRYRVGETVRVFPARKDIENITAEIVSVSDTEVLFRNEAGDTLLALADIEQAKIVF
ncbi:MAG: hypothetical protein ABIE70_07335 [bacterium]